MSEISFPNDNRARVMHAPRDADGAVIAKALPLPPPRAVLLAAYKPSSISASGKGLPILNIKSHQGDSEVQKVRRQVLHSADN